MNKNRWLLLSGALLVTAKVAWLIYSRWGLITVHAHPQPLSQVMQSIERQAGVALRSDLDPSTPVVMSVTRVPLSEALETLATATHTRWRLTYLLAPNHQEALMALGALTAGEPPENWKSLDVPLRLSASERPALPDPRRDLWNVHAPSEQTAQSYLVQASRSVSARFLFPADWNPAIASRPSSGPVTKVVSKIAKLTHGAEQEVVFLSKSRRNGELADAPRESDREAEEARLAAELEKLPPERRAELQAEIDERKRFFESLAGLSEAERRARLEDYFQQPKIQDENDQRQMAQDSRLTPEERLAKAQGYAQRRAAMRAGNL